MGQKTILVTGANGFMGNRLVAEALAQGFTVIGLSRSNAEHTALERVLRELEENMTPQKIEEVKSRLTVYAYDIRDENLGLSPDIIKRLNHSAEIVFNCVGDTNFFPKDKQQLFDTNIKGPARMIKTLCKKGASFNHLSTAYVSGERQGVILEEDLDKGQKFKNDYEESKFLGEQSVHELCKKMNLTYNIFRPSIVIRKHSVHGKSPNLNHFYSFVGLIDILRQDAQTRAHSSTREKVCIPVRFLGIKEAKLNFVDLDYAIQAMLTIALSVPNGNKTYHLVNPNPMTNQEFIFTIMKLYNVDGFQIIEDKEEFVNLNFHERLIKRGLANYIDYFFLNPKFDETNTENALTGTTIHCPEFDGNYISRATGHFA